MGPKVDRGERVFLKSMLRNVPYTKQSAETRERSSKCPGLEGDIVITCSISPVASAL